jgi:hypothetical protein
MRRDLSGCDWCCAGGDEAFGLLLEQEAVALKVLGGVDLAVPRLCDECLYYDAAPGSRTCEKCLPLVQARKRQHLASVDWG